MRISVISKLQESTKLRERYKFMFHYFGCFLDFLPVNRADISLMNRQQNSSR